MQPKAEVEADPKLAAEINELYAFIRNPEFGTHARRYVCRYTAQSRKSELEERPFCPRLDCFRLTAFMMREDENIRHTFRIAVHI
jgi:hypothetical protein